ncbi:hypothetical protein DY000_02022963 [Brassica cretica]|uniref:Uncharacterized protein n=1 Tax=Brassica cretica TaxID=69181 RepID=A0ABQ7E174_BRACR|nr:hypothetical protein DY000_02022963 [Brassica cretica]
MAATKMVFITWFSSSTHLNVDLLILDISGFGYVDFSDLKDFWARRLPDDFQEDFRTTSRKSSDGVFSHVSFHNRSECFVFNQMVLIFHLDMNFVCFTDLDLIYMFFRSGSDFGRPMGSLIESLLKYNVPDDFQEVFQTTSRKSSDEVF